MKQPVILQVLPQLRAGGVERGTIEIAGAIARAGMRALVASAGGSMLPNLAYAGGEHITIPLTTKNPLTIWSNAAELEKIIRKHKVDIIHARSRAPAWSALIAARRTKTPFVTTFHGVYGLSPEFKKHYNAVMTQGDRVIAISNFVAEHIIANYPIDPTRMRIIHRGVDINSFAPERIRHQPMVELAAKWRVPDDLPLILMPGRITRWKGQHVLVEALAKLPHRNFFCLLVGDDLGHPAYRKELEKMICDLGLESNARIAGNTSSMAEAYTLAEVVVCPSVEPEAFGRVPVEAQAMGRAVISTNHGGACETIIDGVTGLLVKPGDADELSKAIERILEMPAEQKQQLAENAIWHVRNNFSAEIMCSKTIEVYRELL
ncbi:MAG TPA: glycosyltransferase family 4 protein [Rickettsiales bacterium]|nr:glycosyltransferase family 4 protein [Rickettsiales bacterium]